MCSTYAKCFVRAVLIFQHKHLETLPAKGVKAGDVFVHVFEEIVSIDDGIDFEFDGVLQAEFFERNKVLDMSPFSTTNLDVGIFIERVARDG